MGTAGEIGTRGIENGDVLVDRGDRGVLRGHCGAGRANQWRRQIEPRLRIAHHAAQPHEVWMIEPTFGLAH